jgi:lysophospholipase L1-like esterase
MAMLRREVGHAVAFNCVVGTALYLASVLAAWRSVDGQRLFPWRVYEAHFLIQGFLAINVVLGAFLFFQRAYKRTAGVCLAVGTLLAVTAIADSYVYFGVFQTFGSGSKWTFTHNHWNHKYVHANERGYWERSLTPFENDEASDAIVIAAVGDSFTRGTGVHGEQYRYTNVAERLLRSRYDPRVTILGYGRGGASTRDEIRIIKEDAAVVKPRTVMIFYLSNDIEPIQAFDCPSVDFSAWQTFFFAVSPTYNYLYWRWRGPSLYAAQGRAYFNNLLFAYLLPESFTAHLDDVGEMIQAVHDIGAKPVLVILPFPRMWEHVVKRVQTEVYAKLADRARQHGACVLELQDIEEELTPCAFEVAATDSHPNERAHALIGKRVAQWLQDNDEFLQSPNRFAAMPTVKLGKSLSSAAVRQHRESSTIGYHNWRFVLLGVVFLGNASVMGLSWVRFRRQGITG